MFACLSYVYMYIYSAWGRHCAYVFVGVREYVILERPVYIAYIPFRTSALFFGNENVLYWQACLIITQVNFEMPMYLVSGLQVCCSALQCVAACCRALHGVALFVSSCVVLHLCTMYGTFRLLNIWGRSYMNNSMYDVPFLGAVDLHINAHTYTYTQKHTNTYKHKTRTNMHTHTNSKHARTNTHI